jgi:uncharacterized protein YlbG (UPF0298 family)
VFCYLQGTIYLAVVLGGDRDNKLYSYSNSDFAGCLYIQQSISGYLFLFARGVISC